DQLQAAASKIIAEKTHAEAGLVTSGACAALTLATAACICGYDVARMDRLPDTTNMPNEVIMPSHQISGYTHAIRAAGAKLIGVGIPHAPVAPLSVYITNKWHIESMITERTAAIAYAVRTGSHPPLEEVIEVGKKYNIPVIVDAAPEVPPVENLHRFIDMGADLVCISGGKGIRGPQNSGILCGRKDLIASAAVQMLEAPSEPYDEWNPPSSFIPKEKFRGTPTHGIGRSMKVSKESIIGLLTALQNLNTERFTAKEVMLTELLQKIRTQVEKIPGIAAAFVEPQYCLCSYPTLEIRVDEKITGISAAEICSKMRAKNIYLRDRYVNQGIVRIYSININEEIAEKICVALSETLNSARS
ncbi:MAG TPA: aminotransferase class V-fold PLP-dependent enzyme, partial [Firmicutes bacterium]|nr:aminotransferase class V-fold PLP-dependent enzyme [Candidatus Fermentithermobacillaceae bacterium]